MLEIAVRYRVPAEEMPKSLIVISDMEIDFCGNKNWTFYEKMAQKFRKFGYQIPTSSSDVGTHDVLSKGGCWRAASAAVSVGWQCSA